MTSLQKMTLIVLVVPGYTLWNQMKPSRKDFSLWKNTHMVRPNTCLQTYLVRDIDKYCLLTDNNFTIPYSFCSNCFCVKVRGPDVFANTFVLFWASNYFWSLLAVNYCSNCFPFFHLYYFQSYFLQVSQCEFMSLNNYPHYHTTIVAYLIRLPFFSPIPAHQNNNVMINYSVRWFCDSIRSAVWQLRVKSSYGYRVRYRF